MQSSNIQKYDAKHPKWPFYMKIENGFEYAENYMRIQVGIHPEVGRIKIVKPWGGASSYPP